MRFLIITISCMLFSILHAEESKTIVADRPGFSTGTYTVQPGRVNIETGYYYAQDTTLPLLDIRIGVSDTIELDILWDGFSDNDSGDSFSDVVVGGKYKVYSNNMYNITLLGLVSLPTGNDKSVQSDYNPILGLLWDYTLAENSSLFGTVQITTYEDIQRVYELQTAIGYSYSFTEKIGTFVEIYTTLPSENSVDNIFGVDYGITYLLTNNIQLDINGGTGLNSNTDNFIGFGIAWRI